MNHDLRVVAKNGAKQSNTAASAKTTVRPFDEKDWLSGDVDRYFDSIGYSDPFDLGEYGHPHESGPDGHGQW